jgi:hypothetical protein
VILNDDGREQRDLTLEQRHGLEHLRALSQLIKSQRMPIFVQTDMFPKAKNDSARHSEAPAVASALSSILG